MAGLSVRRSAFGGRRRVLASVVSLILVGAGALASCGSGDSDSDSPASSTGGTLRLGVLGGGTTETLNPGKMDSDASQARVKQLFEPLVKLSPDGVLQYWLAESLTPSEDGQLYTLKLRPDVTWHDGSPFTVDDVMYTIRTNTKLHTWGSSIYATIDQPNMKKIDDLTLEIPLKVPDFTFPESLIEGNELIYKDGTKDFEEPLGTGPFKFESFTPGQQSVFTRYEDYWGGPAKLAAIEIHSIDDPNARVNALQSGQVDAILDVPFTGIEQLKSAGMTVVDEPTGNWPAIRFQTEKEPFDDPRVREAMALLVDREQIIDNVFGGHAKLGNDLWGWWDPAYAGDIPQRSYDPERARELLAEAGYPDGFTVELQTLPYDPDKSYATLLAASAKEAGVTINVKQMEPAAYYGIPHEEKQWTPTGWGAVPIITQMTEGMSAASIEDGNSEARWADPEFLAAYEAVTLEPDPDKRRELLIKAQEIMHAGVPYIIPAFPNSVDAYSKQASGFKTTINGQFAEYDFTDVSIDQ